MATRIGKVLVELILEELEANPVLREQFREVLAAEPDYSHLPTDEELKGLNVMRNWYVSNGMTKSDANLLCRFGIGPRRLVTMTDAELLAMRDLGIVKLERIRPIREKLKRRPD